MIERFPVTDRAAWLARRESDVTASAAAALLGVHPYISGFGLWLLKSGALKEDPELTPAMQRGLMLEDPAVQLLRQDRPTWRITRARQYFRDPSIRLGATPDAYATDPERGPGLVQVKTVESSIFRKNWRDPDTGEVTPPLWIAVQGIVEAHLTGRHWACVAALTVGFGIDLHVVDIPLHAGVLERVRAKVVEFWKMIEEGRKPEPDYGRDGALLADLYREDNGREIDLSKDNRLPELLVERAGLKARLKTDQATVDEIDAEITGKLGAFERAYVPGWRVSRPTVKRAGYVVAPTTYRQLRVSPIR